MTFGSFLNGRAPERLRGLQMQALTDLGTILERVSVDDAGGGVTQTWGTATVGVQCRIDPLGGRGGGMVAERIDERSTHVVTTPAGTSVNADDRFVITGLGTFEVTATRDRTGARTRVFEVMKVD